MAWFSFLARVPNIFTAFTLKNRFYFMFVFAGKPGGVDERGPPCWWGYVKYQLNQKGRTVLGAYWAFAHSHYRSEQISIRAEEK